MYFACAKYRRLEINNSLRSNCTRNTPNCSHCFRSKDGKDKTNEIKNPAASSRLEDFLYPIQELDCLYDLFWCLPSELLSILLPQLKSDGNGPFIPLSLSHFTYHLRYLLPRSWISLMTRKLSTWRWNELRVSWQHESRRSMYSVKSQSNTISSSLRSSSRKRQILSTLFLPKWQRESNDEKQTTDRRDSTANDHVFFQRFQSVWRTTPKCLSWQESQTASSPPVFSPQNILASLSETLSMRYACLSWTIERERYYSW